MVLNGAQDLKKKLALDAHRSTLKSKMSHKNHRHTCLTDLFFFKIERTQLLVDSKLKRLRLNRLIRSNISFILERVWNPEKVPRPQLVKLA